MILRLFVTALLALTCLHAQPGTRRDFDIPVPAMSDPATRIPVTIFEGARPGPTLLITCGIHGFEFVPIMGAQRVLDQIDPAQLSGKFILVRIAHLPAFERRTLFFNPHDGRNLNRVFPGSPLGTQSQRIAHAISDLIGQADYHIDFHGGDGTETLADFAGSYGGKLAEKQFETSNQIARAFGLPRIVEYKVDTEEQLNTGRSCNRQAVAMGKPTVLVEMGGRGTATETQITLGARGITNVLKSLKMLPGAPMLNRMMPLRFTGTTSLTYTQTGIWYPALTAGDPVTKGALIGVVKSLEGKELERLTSPTTGIILYMNSAPPANTGESALTIAVP